MFPYLFRDVYNDPEVCAVRLGDDVDVKSLVSPLLPVDVITEASAVDQSLSHIDS